MASTAKRTNGQWRARYRDEAGKEHARHFPRKVDAQRWLDEVTAAVVRGDYVDPRSGRRTVASYAAEWLQAQPLRATSRRSYESHLRTHVLPAIGSLPLNRVTRTHVLALARSLEAKGLAETTVRHVIALVSSIFRGALADGLIAKSPSVETVPRRPERKTIKPLTVAEVEALIDAAPERYRAMVVLAAGCGLRIGEVLGLKIGRVRFLEREVDVVEQLQVIPGRRPYLAPPKTRSSVRTVPLPDVVAHALARHLERYPGGPDDLIFRSRTGDPIWPNTFYNSVWHPLRKRAGLPTVRFHDCRHFTASALIRYGESVKTVAAVLGHADEVETLRTYSHLWPDAAERTRGAVDSLLGPRADSLRTEGVVDSA